ncbi:MAG TPA: hypothetical protein VJU58_02790 [Microbacterium sp.]|nr:hypothetical protein [Microbacterium sp.]
MLLDVIRALGRRWYVLVAGLLATAALAFGAYQLTPPVYSARGLVLLLPPQSSVPAGGNPFLVLSDLDLPARLIVAYFQSAPAQTAVEDRSPEAEYTVSIEESTRGPVIAVDVTDASPASTLATLQYLMDDIPVQLARMQGDVAVPAEATVGSTPFTLDTEAEPDYSSTIRIVLAAAAVGVVATGVLAFTLDGLILRRRVRSRSLTDDHVASLVEVSAQTSPQGDHLTPVPARVRRVR